MIMFFVAVAMSIVALVYWTFDKNSLSRTLLLVGTLVTVGLVGMLTTPEVEPVPAIQIDIGDEAFSIDRLEELKSEGKSVMVNFGADWCVSCKTLDATVLQSDEVEQAIANNDVKVLYADWTDHDDGLGSFIEGLSGGREVPLIAIFRNGTVTVFRGLVGIKELVETLNETCETN